MLEERIVLNEIYVSINPFIRGDTSFNSEVPYQHCSVTEIWGGRAKWKGFQLCDIVLKVNALKCDLLQPKCKIVKFVSF